MTRRPRVVTYRCNRCGAEVVWALDTGTKYGAKMRPFDADPHPDGTHLITGDPYGYAARWLHPSERAHAEAIHRPHAKTCTNPPERNTP